MKTFLASFVLCFSLVGAAMAQTAPDITGLWTITVVDNPDDPFSGQILISDEDGDGIYEGDLITQDSCCGGNFARVQQDSVVTYEDGVITATSTIVRFLVREEPNPSASYGADDFRMVWESEDSLIGYANGRMRVRWTRGEAGLV